MSILGGILRLVWIPIVFIFAAMASLTVLLTLGLERITHYVHGQGQDIASDPLPLIIAFLDQAGALMAGLTIIPALAVVLVGEIARIRSFLYYVAGGGLALAAVPLLAQAMTATAAPAGLWQVFATAGFAGGFVYWLLAGRTA